MAIMTSPNIPKRWRRSRRTIIFNCDAPLAASALSSCLSIAWSIMRSPPANSRKTGWKHRSAWSAVANPGIDHCQEDVGDQRADDREHAEHQDETAGEKHVLSLQGLQEQGPCRRQVEHDRCDLGAGDDDGQLP